jgi:hypothetical protein
MIRFFLAVTVLLLDVSASVAMDFRVDGNELEMSGGVTGDECSQLQSILQQDAIRTVILHDSHGGNADAGYCVGELIRKAGLATVIRGYCNSSCSRMWLGGVSRTLKGPKSRVGLHGNYSHGMLRPDAPARLQAWIPSYAPVNRQLMEQWTTLQYNRQMMYFYNDRAELCSFGDCKPLPGWNARNAGLSTQ